LAATQNDNAKIVELLIEKKANVNAQVYEPRMMGTEAVGPAFCGIVHYLSSMGASGASLSTLKAILRAPTLDLAAVDSAGRRSA